MTPEAQRIAIAEACPNIRQETCVVDVDEGIAEGTVWQWFDGEEWNDCHNNDPLSDLNAMHKVEKVLTIPQRGRLRHAIE